MLVSGYRTPIFYTKFSVSFFYIRNIYAEKMIPHFNVSTQITLSNIYNPKRDALFSLFIYKGK